MQETDDKFSFRVDWFTLTAAFRYYLGRMTIAACGFADELTLMARKGLFTPEQRGFSPVRFGSTGRGTDKSE